MANLVLRHLPAETAHGFALRGLSAGLGPRERPDDLPILDQSCFGLRFANPVGVSAGFDKNAVAIAGMTKLGGGFIEVGGVTPLPQAGNPRPRLFRLTPDKAAINRMGFNNDGAEIVRERVSDHLAREPASLPLGINMAANAASPDPAQDFIDLITCFGPVADYLTIDVSCPNTENGQVFLEPTALENLLARLNAARDTSGSRPALVAKLAPDLEDTHLTELIEIITAAGVDAINLCNTTTKRPTSLKSRHAQERGGLSGTPLFEMSNAMLRKVYRNTGGRVPLIGVGGITSGADAYTKICAGANLVQLYTGLVFEGPSLIQRIKHDLAELLKRDGYANITEAVGCEHRA
ncbi:MAG: dihydroorotate dehydrogenase (quinone) [Alphaproteobacteria bacterium]|nr:dihydroorotate dehydrogenase (quinone) [Alphaproteobacteria bacterium]HCP01396.1 dihydroorotate dehydrogenase (quinone) [Rhodospirillaceae bacterium]